MEEKGRPDFRNCAVSVYSWYIHFLALIYICPAIMAAYSAAEHSFEFWFEPSEANSAVFSGPGGVVGIINLEGVYVLCDDTIRYEFMEGKAVVPTKAL